MDTQDQDPRSVKIGELLISLGALSSGDLTEAIQISKRMGVPIGRVLVMSGCVSEYQLQQTLELQSLIKDGLVDRELGEQALKISFKEKKAIQDALKRLNWTPRTDQTGNKLGDLLVDSTIVSRLQLERALETSFQSGMPLGGTLVLQGVLSAQLLPTVLHVQEEVRIGKMDREAALDELKRALMFWARAESSKQENLQKAAKTGNMLKLNAQVSQPSPSPSQAPVGKPSQAPLSQPAQTAMPPAAAAPPQVVAAKKIPLFEGRPQAAPSPDETLQLSVLKNKDPNADNGSNEMQQTDNVSLVELLKVTGFCTQNSLDRAVEAALADSRLASKLLLAIGFIDGTTLNDYIHIQALIARGKLKTDQALYVVNSMRHRKLNLEQALSEVGVAAAL